MLGRSDQFAAPNGCPPLHVVSFNYEIIAQALCDPEKLVGMNGCFEQASGCH